MWIRQDLFSRIRQNANKRIVGSVQNERRHRDAVDKIRCGAATVVIGRALKAAVISRDLVVEVAQSSHAAQARGVELSWKDLRLHQQPPPKLPYEVILVHAVCRKV